MSPSETKPSYDVIELLGDYRERRRKPSQLAEQILAAIAQDDTPIWITLVEPETLRARARALDDGDQTLALYGVPFAVKDSIDVEGMSTTAACPGFAYVATRTAVVVQRLLDAGAMLIGKTNMDQFATGLVGTRSPYGVGSSVSDAARVSGGSSSGSALAVARGHVAFSLGTDTAGSGRVPAGFNSLVGLKPTRGLLSTRGVVPACASLDCVSIFAASVADTAAVYEVAAAYDELDPWSRRRRAISAPRRARLGLPLLGQTEPREAPAAAAWAVAREQASAAYDCVELDVSALLDAAPLLYEAWVAERTLDLGEAVASTPEGLDPTVAAIVGGGAQVSGVDVFGAYHRLAELRRAAEAIWAQVDALLLPTTLLHPTLAQVAADPIGFNRQLGELTNFVNLMDLCGIAIPGPMREDGLPFGLTALAPAFHDERLLEFGAGWGGEEVTVGLTATTQLAVVGAHMRGLALNAQLTARGARFVREEATAAAYRLYALPASGVQRPGLVRVTEGGVAIALEVWELAPAALGELLGDVPAPLALGRVELADGTRLTGFVCEGYAAHGAHDVSEHGGWRAYLGSSSSI